MKPEIGMILYGYCGGYFGNSFDDKRVEAFGVDWIVVREVNDDAFPLFAHFSTNAERDEVVGSFSQKRTGAPQSSAEHFA